MIDNVTFGGFVRTLRKEKQMTQLELAKILNLSDKTISKWEQGKAFPDIAVWEALAEALDVTCLLYTSSLGYSFDWDREINTTDPSYYKWTQWIFLKLFKAGLAYKKEMPINWCTSCKVGLANEEVVNGVCERCGAPVVRKVKSEWMLKITDYAEKLIEGLDHVDYIERVKVSQKNWIGKSQGAEVDRCV